MSELKDVMVLIDQYSMKAGRAAEDYYDLIVPIDSFGIANYDGMLIQAKSFSLNERSYGALICAMVEEFKDQQTLILMNLVFDYDVVGKVYHLSGHYAMRSGQIIYNMFHPRTDRIIIDMYDFDYVFLGNGVLPTHSGYQPLEYSRYSATFDAAMIARSDIVHRFDFKSLTSNNIIYIGNVRCKMLTDERFTIEFDIAIGDIDKRRDSSNDPHHMSDEYRQVMLQISRSAASKGIPFIHRFSDEKGLSAPMLNHDGLLLDVEQFTYRDESLDSLARKVIEGFRDAHMIAFMKTSVITCTDGEYVINGYALGEESQLKCLMFDPNAPSNELKINNELHLEYVYGGEGPDKISEIDGYKVHYIPYKAKCDNPKLLAHRIIDDNEFDRFNSEYSLVIADAHVEVDCDGGVMIECLTGIVGKFPMTSDTKAICRLLDNDYETEAMSVDMMPELSEVVIPMDPKVRHIHAIEYWIRDEFSNGSSLVIGETYSVDGRGDIRFRVMLADDGDEDVEVGYSHTYGKAFDENDRITGIGIDIRNRMGRIFKAVVEEFHSTDSDTSLEAFEKLAHMAIRDIYGEKYDEIYEEKYDDDE